VERDNMDISIYSASTIADYFLAKAQTDEELLSNLKLQKLIYFAQGLHLASEGTPLFNDEIKAWEYGPVVPELYHKYKTFGAGGIPENKTFDPNSIDPDTRKFLDEIFLVFGQFSAIRLMDITHDDQCWKDAHPNGIISHEAMKKDLTKYLKIENG
jgi:uncharacterized phage-associated protein